MSCKLPTVNFKNLLRITFLVLVTFSGRGQTANEQLEQLLTDFMITENPREGIDNLLSFEGRLEQAKDSLQGHYYLNLGIAYGQVNHADSSFWYLKKAEKIAHNTKSDFLLAMVNNTRGLVFMGKAEYEASLNAFQKVMKLAEGKDAPKLNDVLSKTYGNLGGVYYQLGQIDKALETTKKSLELSEVIQDTTDIALNHLRLAMVYNDLNQFDNGIDHLNKARTFFKDLENPTMLVYAESNLGKIFLKQKKLDSAYAHYKEAHNYAKTLGEQEEHITTLIAMATVKLEQKQLANAKNYAQAALVRATENGYANSEQKAYDILYKIALEEGKTAEALDYRNASIALSDSLGNVEVKARVADLETKYETAKKEKEIQQLTFESELNSAKLAKAKNELIIIIVSSLAVIGILILLFYTRNKKIKAEREAQSLQVEALQKRFMELHSSPSELSVALNMDELNHKLHTPLTEREFETFKLCVSGKTNATIAEELFVTVSTVKFHLRNAYSKLGVNNRKEAFQYVLESI